MPEVRVPRHEPSACEWLARLGRRELSSVELTRLVLERIDGVTQLNAVVTCDPDAALEQASRADARRAAADGGGCSGSRSPSRTRSRRGVSRRSAARSRAWGTCQDATRPSSAACARRVQSSSRRPTCPSTPGRTRPTTSSPGGRCTRSIRRGLPGGSSGGEAALLGADASIVGIGTDGGGSIRVPSHYCGTVGLRPTAGLVPETGCWPPTRDTGMIDMSTVGPMARYVEDLELLLPILAGPDGIDPFVDPTPLVDARRRNDPASRRVLPA